MRPRVMVPTVVILLLVFALVGVTVSNNISSSVNNVVESQMNETLDFVRSQLELADQTEISAQEELNAKNVGLAHAVAQLIANDPAVLETGRMQALAVRLGVDEINVSDEQGILRWGNDSSYFGLDFSKERQTQPFMTLLLSRDAEVTQTPQRRASDDAVFQYVGVSRIDKAGIVQLGVSLESVEGLIGGLEPQSILQNTLIGTSGGVIVLDTNNNVLADSSSVYLNTDVSEQPWVKELPVSQRGDLNFSFGTIPVVAKTLRYDDKVIIAYIPESELAAYRTTPMLITGIIGGVGLLVLVFLLYIIFTRVVLKPLDGFVEQVEDINEGQRIEIERFRPNSELAFVGQTVNDMLDRMQASSGQVDELRVAEARLQAELDKEQEMSSMLAELKRQDELLTTSNTIAERLALSTPQDFQQDLDVSLSMLGKSAQADRVLLWQLLGSDGLIELEVRCQWWMDVEDSKRPGQLSSLALQPELHDWLDGVMRGETLNAEVALLPYELRSLLEPQGIASVLIVPVFVDQQFWGFMEFTGYDRPLEFSSVEQGILRSACLVIANAISTDQMTASLVRAREAAVTVAQARSEFLAEIGREIQTPLSAIIGLTKIGLASDDYERKEYSLQKVSEASKRLLSIVNSTMDTSRMEPEKLELQPVVFRIDQMFQGIVGQIRGSLEEKGLRFSILLDRAVPHVLVGDDKRLAQVLVNLLANAIRFTPERGSIECVVKLAAAVDGILTVRVSVTDTGIGMAPELAESLLRPPAASDGAAGSHAKASRLLASKKLVELMGGTMFVSSTPGVGSNFTFTFKTREGDASQLDAPVSEQANTVAPQAHGSGAYDPDASAEYAGRALSPKAPLEQGHAPDAPGRALSPKAPLEQGSATTPPAYAAEPAAASSPSEYASGVPSAEVGPQHAHGSGAYDTDVSAEYAGRALSPKAPLEQGSATAASAYVAASSPSEYALDDSGRALSPKAPLEQGHATTPPAAPAAHDYPAGSAASAVPSVPFLPHVVPPVPEQGTDFATRSFLIADDEEASREALADLLEPTQAHLTFAENGLQALDRLMEAPRRYDLVLMDVQMPVLDGIEATRRIRALPLTRLRELPIVAMTSSKLNEDTIRFLAAGMTTQIAKPFDPEELMRTITENLRQD